MPARALIAPSTRAGLGAKLSKALAKGANVLVMGTGECYTAAELDALPPSSDSVRNLIGRDTFAQWVGCLARASWAVMPEGLPAFLSLALRVPSFVYFADRSAVQRMPVAWRRIATLYRMESGPRWSPGDPAAVAESVMAAIAPDRLRVS